LDFGLKIENPKMFASAKFIWGYV